MAGYFAILRYGPWNDGNSWESSSHTLPREVTWNPELEQLVYSPLKEQERLRGAVIGNLTAQPLGSNKSLSLGLPAGQGNQSEAVVSFERPSDAVTLSVSVMVDESTGVPGVEFFVDYMPPTAHEKATGVSEVAVRCSARGRQLARDTLRLSGSDTTIDVRVFADTVFSEVYFQNGRVAMTVPSLCNDTRNPPHCKSVEQDLSERLPAEYRLQRCILRHGGAGVSTTHTHHNSTRRGCLADRLLVCFQGRAWGVAGVSDRLVGWEYLGDGGGGTGNYLGGRPVVVISTE